MRKLHLLAMMLLLLPAIAFSQTNRVVTGRVTDEKGDPVPFATVKVKGAKSGISADENGIFRITVADNAVLVFSASGTDSKEVSVSGQSAFNVSLTRVNTELTAVTVVTTSLGIKRQSKELGYAATSLNNKTLTQGKATNVQQALNGKVSGLSISTTDN